MSKKIRLKRRNRRFRKLLLPNGEIMCDRCRATGSVTHTHKCNDCNGTGVVIVEYRCDFCLGNGSINWIDYAVGKKPVEEISDFDYDDIPF